MLDKRNTLVYIDCKVNLLINLNMGFYKLRCPLVYMCCQIWYEVIIFI